MSNKTLIIAEAGVNHNGDLDTAKKLVDVAAMAGADLVKFQTFSAERIVSPKAQKAVYQQKNLEMDSDRLQFNMLKDLELSDADHRQLIDYCNQRGIAFFFYRF